MNDRPMRIAHVANTDYFCAFLLRSQLDWLRERGYSVDVVCGPGPLVDALRNQGFPVHVVENARRIDPFADLRTLRAYTALFRRERYDLVHTHNPKVNAIASLAARLARVPRVVSTVHGLYSHEGQGRVARSVWRGFEAASARLADLVLCQSAEDVRTARWNGIVPDERLRALGNGVDLERFSPRQLGADDVRALRRRHGVRDDEIVIGFVGRLVEEKGVRELVDAVSGRPGWKLWLVGPDEQGAKVDALEPHALAGRPGVRWLGLQREMPPLYAAMDLTVLPSYREGFPRSLIEAAAMGRPSIATRIRGCREAISDHETGLLVPPRDPAALRAAIGSLTNDRGRRRAYGRAARIRAARRFDERAVFDRILRAYREIPLATAPLPLRATAGHPARA